MTTSVPENSSEQFAVNRRGLPDWSPKPAVLAVTACLIIAFVGTRSTSAAERVAGPAEGQQTADLPTRPNIVFLYTDDQAQWAMGAYGNADIKTPNLDRLAQRGAIFKSAFTITPVCSPSRAAMMTSRYPSELGITDWIDPRREPDLGLAPAAITWPDRRARPLAQRKRRLAGGRQNGRAAQHVRRRGPRAALDLLARRDHAWDHDHARRLEP